jgi:hypothetical protein
MESIMSKKYKRQVRKAASAGTEDRPAVPTTSTMASRSQSTSQTAFNPDYSYVVKDLRRIGILAGTFISILVILSFFLR